MIGRGLLALLLMATAMGARAAWDIDELMTTLARSEGGTVQFVETRTMALLDRPLVSRGDMLFQPPNRLEKHTRAPQDEILVLDDDTLTIEQDGQRSSFNVASRPEARAFVESVRSTLAGQRKTLEKYFQLELKGKVEDWALVLRPIDWSVQALVDHITIAGQDSQVHRITYVMVDGDRTELSIEHPEP